ncbi:uncharacterized protein LOC130980892 [Arachis stenosperma]|uniref:uncharacterized protein LOC130980892 n=1 Tax=Arachis stenosperma TaxID=217475 RepID=UPI0025AD00A9|nr:uncharacterized protein LOC130980892 [Arachis stenosperma]
MEIFNKACLKIQNLPTEAVIMRLVNGLKEGLFSQSISNKHPVSLNEVQEKAKKYINIDENFRLREPLTQSNLPYQAHEKDKEPNKKEEQNVEKPLKYHNYTALILSLVNVYREICHTEKLSPPRSNKHKKGESRTKYCEYHKLYEHSTNECYDLKNVIEKIVRKDRLDRYLANKSDDPKKRMREEEEGRQERPPQTPKWPVHVINEGFTGEGMSKSSRKRHLKGVYHVGKENKLPDLPTSRSP